MSYIPKLGDRIKAIENGVHTGTVIALENSIDGKIVGVLLLFDVEDAFGVPLTSVYLNYWRQTANGARYSLITNIDQYLGREIYWFAPRDCQPLKENKPTQKGTSSTMDGANCIKCGEFAMYANPNFTCYAGRQDKYRFSRLNVDDPIA